jgi:phospholipase/carboxylesterase
MSYAAAFGEGRRRPAAVVALSGFVPRVPGFALDLGDLDGYPIAIVHGSYDPVIPEGFGAEARRLFEAAGADVLWRETPVTHTIDPRIIPELADFVQRAVR